MPETDPKHTETTSCALSALTRKDLVEFKKSQRQRDLSFRWFLIVGMAVCLASTLITFSMHRTDIKEVNRDIVQKTSDKITVEGVTEMIAAHSAVSHPTAVTKDELKVLFSALKVAWPWPEKVE